MLGSSSLSLLADALAVEQGAMAGGLCEAPPQNQVWGVPEVGSAGCCAWKGRGDPEKL